ncbi:MULTISPECIES: RNA polymerase-binding protein RbpA [unclassified Crossiella]|uniref:RNA polymerase-binding protein RbpA n=1 Tax=unclassified Crossiella TaxID=2620835 RepID=UPI0027E4E91E|nr:MULTISPECIES: RNA polymerase-binding protein RbpA [unclassified Crossiella]
MTGKSLRRIGARKRPATVPRHDEVHPRRVVLYDCPRGHQFEMPFAHEADAPSTWGCRSHSTTSTRAGTSPSEEPRRKPPRTHWDVLCERRSSAELEQLLTERLDWLDNHRGSLLLDQANETEKFLQTLGILPTGGQRPTGNHGDRR